MSGLLDQLDAQISELLLGWNSTSSLIVLAIVGYLSYLTFSTQDPDTHPMLLQRQSVPARVRKPGESAVYRNPDTPHSLPLRSGLNVKQPGAPLYANGQDGDLRDIWRRVTGEIPLEKSRVPGLNKEGVLQAQGKIMTVLGKEEVTEHAVCELTKEIHIIGSLLRKQGAKRVAVCLPNCVEFLTTLFACSFYGLTAVLIPYNQPHDEVIKQLAATQADALVVQAGSVPLGQVAKGCKELKQVIWVVEKTSRHVDWTEVPEHVGGALEIGMWHQLIQDNQDASISKAPDLKSHDLPGVITVWTGKPGTEPKLVEFSQKNIVAAVAALQVSVPPRQRLTPSDLFLSADSWTNSYALCWTLAALFSLSSIAISSVAGPGVSLALATRSIAPTVLVASAETVEKFHAESAPKVAGGLKKFAHDTEKSVLDAGRMPAETLLTRLNPPHRAALGATPGKLRLLLVAERSGAGSPPLSSDHLSDIRIFTGARVIYALAVPEVAGAVSQTGVYDYRRSNSLKNERSHFGALLTCLEAKLVDSDAQKTTDDGARGQLVVSGPSVAGGEVKLSVMAKFNDDATLAYI